MKTQLALALPATLAAIVVLSGCAERREVVVRRPARARAEAVTVAPRHGAVWVAGHHEWRRHRRVWIPGHWI